MNVIQFGKIAGSMIGGITKNRPGLGSLVVLSLIVLVGIRLPLLGTEPGADDSEKSSRKTKTQQAAPASNKSSSDKGSAEKISTEKNASEKSTSDKSTSEKTTSDKSASEKSTSDKGSTDTKNGKPKDSGRLELDSAHPKLDGKKSSRADEPLRLVADTDGGHELTIEAQQKKDQGECPGSEGSKVPVTQNVNDVPLDQEEHPFDAPAAQTDDEPMVEEGEPPAPIKKPIANKSKAEDSRSETHSESARQLEQRINTCLAYYYTHKENLAKRSPWAVMHTILPFGVETDITAGNRNVNAIGWMCYNGVCKTQRVFQTTNTGFRTNVGPGVQGHEGQFLAVLAQSSVPRSFPMVIGKNRYTVSDLIRYEMVTCREKSELTFKLIALSHYLSPTQTWRDDRGHTWNLEKLVREELDQPIVGAACGGTHRLMGLSYALMMRRRYEQPINGHWSRADVYLKDFVQYAWSLQNPDGSFSTDWFEGRANEPNMERKVQTTGHILEWLVFTLPAEDLHDPRVAKSVEFLLSQVYDHRDKDWPIGPRGHSLRAISLVNQRVFGAPTGQLKNHLAQAGYMKDLR